VPIRTITVLEIKPGDKVRRSPGLPWETVVSHDFSYAAKSKGTVIMRFLRRQEDTPFMVRTWDQYAHESTFEILEEDHA
jgi:hypothetical protein